MICSSLCLIDSRRLCACYLSETWAQRAEKALSLVDCPSHSSLHSLIPQISVWATGFLLPSMPWTSLTLTLVMSLEAGQITDFSLSLFSLDSCGKFLTSILATTFVNCPVPRCTTAFLSRNGNAQPFFLEMGTQSYHPPGWTFQSVCHYHVDKIHPVPHGRLSSEATASSGGCSGECISLALVQSVCWAYFCSSHWLLSYQFSCHCILFFSFS